MSRLSAFEKAKDGPLYSWHFVLAVSRAVALVKGSPRSARPPLKREDSEDGATKKKLLSSQIDHILEKGRKTRHIRFLWGQVSQRTGLTLGRSAQFAPSCGNKDLKAHIPSMVLMVTCVDLLC